MRIFVEPLKWNHLHGEQKTGLMHSLGTRSTHNTAETTHIDSGFFCRFQLGEIPS